MRTKRWNIEQLKEVAKISRSVRQVIQKLGLVEAGGNYVQIKYYLTLHKIDISHFTGPRWNKGLRGIGKPLLTLDQILTTDSDFQSFKLKKRLFDAKLKFPECEECGWKKESEDGRVPVELDHINGDRKDNRLENLRILCPNCHSLKPTHRGRNKYKKKYTGQWRNWYTRNT